MKQEKKEKTPLVNQHFMNSLDVSVESFDIDLNVCVCVRMLPKFVGISKG